MIKKISKIKLSINRKQNKKKYIPLKDNRPTFDEIFQGKLSKYK